MKTIAEFKRRLQVGTPLRTVRHRDFGPRSEGHTIIRRDVDLGIRKVGHVQSNSFAIATQKEDGSTVLSWVDFPKASLVKFTENSITIMEEHTITKELEPIVTYKFIN